jgi:hypothetical protein
MRDIATAILSGNLTRDVELRALPSVLTEFSRPSDAVAGDQRSPA